MMRCLTRRAESTSLARQDPQATAFSFRSDFDTAFRLAAKACSSDFVAFGAEMLSKLWLPPFCLRLYVTHHPLPVLVRIIFSTEVILQGGHELLRHLDFSWIGSLAGWQVLIREPTTLLQRAGA